MRRFLKYFYVFLLGCSLCVGCQNSSTTASDATNQSTSEKQSVSEEEGTSEEQGTGEEKSKSQDIFAMDTYMTVTAYGEKCEEAVDAAVAEIERLDDLLSTGSDDSEVTKINKNGGGTLSEDTSYLVKRALEVYKDTDGAFDISIYPVMKAWGFAGDTFQVPDKKTLSNALSLVDASKISYNEKKSTISFEKKGMQIDLGGIAKGYTSDRVIEILKSYGIEHAMINLGGNVDLLGKKTDGSEWRIAVQDPEDEDSYVGVLSVSDEAVITSGGYERYFEEDGVTYHHIIDPATGYPANNGLISVTIVSDDGTLADGLSTSLFVMGKDKAISYWRSHSDQFSTILIGDDETIYISEDIADSFESSKKVEVLSKSE